MFPRFNPLSKSVRVSRSQRPSPGISSINTFAWTGGDPDALITVYFVDHLGWADVSIGQQGKVSDGSMSITWQEGQGPGSELDIEVTLALRKFKRSGLPDCPSADSIFGSILTGS